MNNEKVKHYATVRRFPVALPIFETTEVCINFLPLSLCELMALTQICPFYRWNDGVHSAEMFKAS